jgi:glycosyltransferase involved in cell wall biosynthesis
VKVIALLPVKNEAWIIQHTLASLSGFCDVILLNDQQSTDGTHEIAARFPKAVWIESAESTICEQARWRLWDVARDYDGTNLVWCTDADELVSPRLVRRFLDEHRAELTGGAVIDSLYCHFWTSPERYRTGLGGAYAPHLKPVAIVDDRRAHYDRSRALPLHEERVPIAAGARRLKAEHVPVLHLQWLLPNRSQMRQAWYRCREWMQGGRTAVAINEQYAHTLPERFVPTAPIPHEWIDDVTLPGTGVDAQPSWHEADILRWFDERGVTFFEPIEIWSVRRLRQEFRKRTGRNPRPDRSYLPSRFVRAQKLGRRVLSAGKRRIIP